MKIDSTSLISHRFRGFSDHENTIDGLNAALDFGVAYVEFDIRVAKCGTPMIYHDEQAKDRRGQHRLLCDYMARDYTRLGGAFSYMPRAEALFHAIGQHPNTTTRFLIDIKDAGFETEIHALVSLCRLQDHVSYVTWVPNVLYRMAEIAPHIPLCLSHWCQSPSAKTRKIHTVHNAKGGHVPQLSHDYIHGDRSGWYLDHPLRGELLKIIKESGRDDWKGAVCVPQNMVTQDLVAYYHSAGLEVSTFSYLDWDHIRDHKDRYNIDLFFIDNKTVFDEA